MVLHNFYHAMHELCTCAAYWLLCTVYAHGILKVNKFLKMNTTTVVLLALRAQRRMTSKWQ